MYISAYTQDESYWFLTLVKNIPTHMVERPQSTVYINSHDFLNVAVIFIWIL